MADNHDESRVGMKGRTYDRVICPSCERWIAAYVPMGSDGRALVLIAHNRVTIRHRVRAGDPCPAAHHRIVVESGTWRLAS